MNKQYQVTLLCSNGKYRPLSRLIGCEKLDLSNREMKRTLVRNGLQKICSKRYRAKSDLKQYSYTNVKVREYDKTKIETEARIKYKAIKEAHYQDGSWKRPQDKEKENRKK